MASATQALSGTPSSAGGGFSSPVDALKGQSQPRVDEFQKKIEDAEKSRSEKMSGIEDERSKLTPPVPAKPTPSPTFHPTDPVKAWGSLAMVAAMIGSAFTRTPMVSALNAATSALDAFHKGDLEKSKIAFDQWKAANDQAMQHEEYQSRLYMQQMAALDRRENMTERQYSDAVRTANYELMAQAKAFGDERMIAALEQNGLLGAQRLQVARDNSANRQAVNASKVTESYAKQKALQDLVNSDEYKKATPVQQLGMLAKANPSHATLTPAQADSLVLKMRSQMQKESVGKSYDELRSKWPIIQEADRQMKTAGHLNAQTAAAVVDGFQRIYNNQAVRIGLVKLNTDHAPYMDQLALEATKWQQGGGGPLAPQQAKDMLALLHEYANNLNKLKQQQVKEYRDTAEAFGLDPELVAPSRYQTDTHAHEAPAAMKANPEHLIGAALGVPVTITSGQRSASRNKAAGGSDTSEHLTGNAWDFKPHGMGLEQAAQQLATVLHANGQRFDQILVEPKEGIVHVGFGPKMRGQVSYYDKGSGKTWQLGQGPKTGSAHYASADQVIAAAKAGKLPVNEATRILKTQFGYSD